MDAEDPTVVARQESEARARMVLAAVGEITLYDIELGEDARVSDVYKRTVMPKDEIATKANERMAAKVPSGPKKNDTSFRTSVY